jgi:DNA repair photolyase
MSGVTDCYQPAERKFRLTRGCLEVFAEFRNPVGIVTKNHLVTRDLDVLGELARHHAVAVYITITSLDADLVTRLEPRAALPALRLKTVSQLAAAGIPVGVMVAPIIPAITDHEVPAILDAAHRAGAREAGFVVLRLPHGVKDLFERWVEQHFPDRKDKVFNRIRSLRDGKLNDPRFGSRMHGEGIFAEQIAAMFRVAKRKAGFADTDRPQLSTASFRNPQERQMRLL